MANFLCFVTDGVGGYTATEVATQAECTGFIASASVDYVSLGTLGALFQQYFAFDEALFAEVVGWSLVSFAIGHGLGRLMQVWRKTF